MADYLVLSCIDPRFTYLLGRFLGKYKQIKNNYDLFALAGASLGCNINEKWATTFFDHINIAEMLHNIKEIWVFDHLDCGAYIHFLGLKKDKSITPHLEQLLTLKQTLSIKYPNLKFRGFIMDKSGKINEAI